MVLEEEIIFASASSKLASIYIFFLFHLAAQAGYFLYH